MPSVTALSIAPSSHIAWLSSDGTLRIWDGHTVASPTTLPNARLLAFASEVVTSHQSPSYVQQLHPASQKIKKTPLNGVAIALATYPHKLYASFDQGTISTATYDGTSIASMPYPGAPLTAAFSLDAEYLATGDIRGNIHVFRPPQCVLTLKAHAAVPSLAWSDKLLASAGWDGTARVWDLAGREVAAFRRNRRKLHAIALSPDGTLLATGGASGEVTVWRISEKRPLAEHSAHDAAVYALAFTPDSRHVASGSADGTIRLFGVPTKPQLVTEAQNQASEESGVYHITPASRIVQGQRADRRLIFVPSTTVTLACPICDTPYNSSKNRPMCSGVCGHTFACSTCNEKLWSTDEAPRCPVCRAALVDVAYNYELLRIVSASRPDSNPSHASAIRDSDSDEKDVIQLSRLSWVAEPALAYSMNHSSIIYKGHLDGEAVAVRVPRPTQVDSSGVLAHTSAMSSDAEVQRHIRCLRDLRGPHLVQFYGVARLPQPDGRQLVVSELPAGGTLAENLSRLRQERLSLSEESILSLSKQILRAVRFLHESQFSAGYAISPHSITLSSSLEDDWSIQHPIKLIDLGGTISRAECTLGTGRSFPRSYIGYMAPEILDEDRALFRRDLAFKRACSADMYSVGVLVWALASGKDPFDGMRPAQVVAAVIGRDERPGYPPNCIPPQLQELISNLWALDPEQRPTAKQACQILDLIPSAPPP